MLTSRRFKGTLLLVGLLTVGFGLIAAFQVQEVDAHTPWGCFWLSHRANPSPYNPGNITWTINLSKRSITGTCGICGGSATLTSWRQRIEVYTQWKYQHKYEGSWVHCHSHLSLSSVSYRWSPPTVTCHNSNCGG